MGIAEQQSRQEVLDLRHDPGETANRSRTESLIRNQLEAILDRHLSGRPLPRAPAIDLDAQTEEQLKQLGYLEK